MDDLNEAIVKLDQLRRLLTLKRFAADQIEDVCQSTFLRWLRTNQRQPGRLPASYIVRLGQYESTSFVRRGRPSEAAVIDPDSLPAAFPECSDGVTSRERTIAVRIAVSRLRPRLREVLVLHFYEGLKLREIAERCGESINTVKLRLHRAKQTLRKTLDAHRNN